MQLKINMTNKLNNIIKETDRLLNLSSDERRLEGVYADDTQLNFLRKKMKSNNKVTTVYLNGLATFISDLASSNSKILLILDETMEEYCA